MTCAARLDALEREVAELKALVRRRAVVDDDDHLALLEALAVTLDGGDFTAEDVAAKVSGNPQFEQLAADADVSPAHIAYWLRSMHGAMIGPLTLERIGTARPARWQFL